MNKHYDVFISGAGPVGLLLAFNLTRLGHSVFIIDAVDKSSGHATYGRACMLYPRTLEIFDQLDLYDDISQVGFASDRSWGYKDGQPIDRRWGFFDAPESGMKTTFFKTTLSIRLKHTEDLVRQRLAEIGVPVHAPVKLVDFKLDRTAPEGYQVTATCQRGGDPSELFNVSARYIVGCDGGGSMVRRIARIPFTGERKLEYWVRVDGIVKTNVPEARFGLGAFESSTHGHVLWLSLDDGATRIGYVLSKELFQKYGTQMSAEEAASEAGKAVAPFELEFLQIDWHTVYGIQQHVAERFQQREHILIAGDAAHTHSSGSAQGMNTGVQDVTNLSWRLAGTLKGWYYPEVLQNYSEERRSIAMQLIHNDKIISTLVAQGKPEHLKHRPEHAHVLLDEFLRKNSGFSTGLAIEYGPNLLNDSRSVLSPTNMALLPGRRMPDALLQRPGLASPKTRFYNVTKNNGKFRIIVFPGAQNRTRHTLCDLREQVNNSESKLCPAVEFITIVPGVWHAFDEFLGVKRFGNGYWDPDLSAHRQWGISDSDGAILVLRPDGVLGRISSLEDFDGVMAYMERILNFKGLQSWNGGIVKAVQDRTHARGVGMVKL